MAYAIIWNSNLPDGSLLDASDLDLSDREIKKSVEERMQTLIGNDNWKNNVDPVIDGSTVMSMLSLTSAVNSKPSINSGDNFIPKRSNSSTFVNSAISEVGGKIVFSNPAWKINGQDYFWPASVVSGNFLQYSAGGGGQLAWVNVTQVGGVAGVGSVNKIPLWVGVSNISDSIMTQSGGVISIAGALSASGQISAASMSASGLITAASFTGDFQGTATLSTAVISASLALAGITMSEVVSGSADVLTLVQTNPTSNKVAINLSDTNGGEYRVNGTKVVEVRKTGWGGPTGTATRTSYDTASVTLPELAQRLKALIDDLTTHGLIGA